jgi:hypothetical protein
MTTLTAPTIPTSLDLVDEEKLAAYQARKTLTSKYNTVRIKKRKSPLASNRSLSAMLAGI